MIDLTGKTLLVTGGSQGARRLNESIPAWRARGYPIDHDAARRHRADNETAPARVTRHRGRRHS